MKRLLLGFVLPAVLVLAWPAVAGAKPAFSLDMYRATVAQGTYSDLLAKGYDIASADASTSGQVALELVLSKGQAQSLRAQGVNVQLQKNELGLSARAFAALQASTGYTVWRDYDGPDGFRAQLYDIAKRNRDIAKLKVIGHTIQGREMLALKLTADAKHKRDGARPAVLYSALQHAREWVAGEVNIRLLRWYIEQYRAKDPEIKKLLKSTELWFVPVANPDGYQYTFQSPDTRLWRKNLRDNNGNGTIEVGDGVDPNRNYPEHWNYDQEGSSDVQSSDTYRGPAATSERETKALKGLLDKMGFAFLVNYHSYGPWILYPEGWQSGTPSADDPIYYALSGNLDNPAIEGFYPTLSSGLYVTNGETTDYAHVNTNTLAWTPELEEGCEGCGFVFPDDEALVQAEFEKNIPFALDVAKSAKDPDDPVSHLGIETKPFYLKSDDTYKAGMPLANFTFDVSYGDPQKVRVLAKRSLGDVRVKYRINGGKVRSDDTRAWRGGETYGAETDVYYHVVQGVVRGTRPGDSVEVWFESRKAKSDSFTYTAAVESRNKVLILSAEDYTGASPAIPDLTEPLYLSYYQDALAANGIGYDVYDVDANGRKAPSPLGVLGHYKAVVWYTGEDTVTREPGWPASNMSRLAMDEMLNARDYINEGGKVLYTGKYAGFQFTANTTQLYDPTDANEQCVTPQPAPDPPVVLARCLFANGSGDLQGDVIEYWFGAFLLNFGAGINPEDGSVYGVLGTDTPFDSLSLAFNGADSAQNQDNANSFITTSGILPVDTYPQFESWASMKYDRPGGPFAPHTGDSYAYSQIADVSYKQLTRTIDVPAGGGSLTFWTSYNTEAEWDHLFVEAHHPGVDDWTTLPDANGATTQETGQSCPAGWNALHPWLDHYQTITSETTCDPSGTTGDWNAASGDSAGWQEWSIDLSDYAGGQVEVSISYASDWATQGLGVFVDDVTLPDGSTTSFEGGDTGGWVVSGPPPGSAPNSNNFVFTTAAGFPEGAAVSTPDTLYLGFGLEGVDGADTRAEVMGRAVNYLLGH